MWDINTIVQVIQAVSLIGSVLWSAFKIVHKISSLEESFQELSLYVKDTLDVKLEEHARRLSEVEVAIDAKANRVRRKRA